MADNKSIARGNYDAWNARDFDRIAGTLTPDGKVVIMGTGQTFNGPDGSRQFSRMWADAFPDGTCTVECVTGDGDHVAVEYTGRGTHTGTLNTPMGAIPATGRAITIKLCDMLDFKEGKITAQRQYLDTAALLSQLGITSLQTTATT